MFLSISSFIRDFVDRLSSYSAESDPVYSTLFPRAKQALQSGQPAEGHLNSIVTAMKNRLMGLRGIDFVASLKVLKPNQLQLISNSISNVIKELGDKPWVANYVGLKAALDKGGDIGEHDIPEFLQQSFELVQSALRDKDNPKAALEAVDGAMLKYKAAQPLLLRAQMTPLK